MHALTPSHLQEAEKAKTVIADLEAELQAERIRLRKMFTEQDRLQREIGEVARQLQRTETVILSMAFSNNHPLISNLGYGRRQISVAKSQTRQSRT